MGRVSSEEHMSVNFIIPILRQMLILEVSRVLLSLQRSTTLSEGHHHPSAASFWVENLSFLRGNVIYVILYDVYASVQYIFESLNSADTRIVRPSATIITARLFFVIVARLAKYNPRKEATMRPVITVFLDHNSDPSCFNGTTTVPDVSLIRYSMTVTEFHRQVSSPLPTELYGSEHFWSVFQASELSGT